MNCPDTRKVATRMDIFCDPRVGAEVTEGAAGAIDVAQRYRACRVYLVFNGVCLLIPPDAGEWDIAADYYAALEWKSKRRRKRWLFWRRP